jgi:D-aspartate ligase
MIPLLDKLSDRLPVPLTALWQHGRPRSPEASQLGSCSSQGASTASPSGLPPVLLLTPAHYGTLAAVRSFGRASISVTIAGTSPWTVAAFSKYTRTSLICPSTTDSAALLAWLEEFGRTHERHVLLPTCDDTAWLYARHRERLAPHFYLGSSSISAVHRLLHKARLAEEAAAVGMDTPMAWVPRSESELATVAREAVFPLLVKPTTQALFAPRSKGRVVESAAELPEAYRELASLPHGADIVAYDPSAALPIVQELFPDASERIYNISGYVRDGKMSGARAGIKVLQRPRRLGVGLCFEEAPLDPRLVEGLERLAERVGFAGVFEAEFVRTEGRDVLIDYNPRFYNQLAFDVARGLPLPLLAYADALRAGGEAAVEYEILPDEPTGKVFVYSSAFKVLVLSQKLSGALTAEDADAWLDWYATNEAKRVDAVDDPDDAWPGRLDAVEMLRHHVRHPRSFLRRIVLNR